MGTQLGTEVMQFAVCAHGLVVLGLGLGRRRSCGKGWTKHGSQDGCSISECKDMRLQFSEFPS